MLSRLIIIVLVLCVPLAVAMLAQQITREVPAPELSSAVLDVQFDKSRKRPLAADADGQEVPLSYTPRSVKHIYPDQDPASAAANAGTSEKVKK
ncbi:hypothetical protein [Neisseria sp.]|uniref:hypothetical protein n=1 Tax=Neisseria sp. TaxID=192066 RepID=UPI0026DAC54E|nr:hypothetical protein [Neisseria sp.]MDO4227738.1 hypothetical protein [Neisseria sp.]